MTNGLQKILTELKADKPRIDYVIGILETLIEMQGEKPLEFVDQDGATWVPTKDQQAAIRQAEKNAIREKNIKDLGNEPKDEGAILDAQTKARIDAVKAMAEKSTEIS